MKLLFDENLSHTLVDHVGQAFRGCAHVRDVGLRGADDARIWDHARAHNFMIVSKDTDFRERSYVEGFPPKVIWLDVGAAGTMLIARLLERERQRIERFEHDRKTSLLILSIGRTSV